MGCSWYLKLLMCSAQMWSGGSKSTNISRNNSASIKWAALAYKCCLFLCVQYIEMPSLSCYVLIIYSCSTDILYYFGWSHQNNKQTCECNWTWWVFFCLGCITLLCLHARWGAGSWKLLFFWLISLVGFQTSSRMFERALQRSTLQITKMKSPVPFWVADSWNFARMQ